MTDNTKNLGKNIILIGTAYPYRGGLASFNERLIREFVHQNYNASIETFSLQYPSFLFPGKTQFSDSPKPSDININISVNSINPVNWIKTGLRIKKTSPDIVIFKYWIPYMAPCFGTIARIIKSNKKSKIITIIDNIIPHENRPGDKLFSKYFVDGVDGFIAMSDSVLNDLSTFNKTKPRALTPHPVFDNFGKKIDRKEAIKRLNLDENNRYMLFFGFIRDYKGLDILLEAFADKWFHDQNIQLIVAGEFYANEEKYLSIIDKYDLHSRIKLFNHFITDEEVVNYFCAADIIVQPYKSATQSGVTQIGYHFEKPMLVTDVGGLSEIIPHNKAGYVVQPDPKSISLALIDFFENERKTIFENNLLKEKEKYSWDKMVSAIEIVFNKI